MADNQKFANAARPGDSPVLIAKLWADIEVRIPIGYQNKTGFHYGIRLILPAIEQLPENRPGLLQPWMWTPA